jgi:hypothetical protein
MFDVTLNDTIFIIIYGETFLFLQMEPLFNSHCEYK